MITFSRPGIALVSLKEPTWPEGPEYLPRQTIGYSDGGAIKVAINGDEDVVIRLAFRDLPSTQWDALLSFLHFDCSWSGFTFAYLDWNGATDNNVRYVEGVDTFKRRRGGKVNGTLVLRRDLGV